MRNIENWQYVVHDLNKRKGFYDYEKDIAIIEKALPELEIASLIAGEDGYMAEVQAMKRILVDYKRALHERKLLLVIGELCEAHEELRSGHEPREIYFNDSNPKKPEGVPIELADAQIRLWDLEQAMGIDGEYAATMKHEYNESRPYKHGKQF